MRGPGATLGSMRAAIDAEINAGDVRVVKAKLIKAGEARGTSATDEEGERW